jgi:hypothetical protein
MGGVRGRERETNARSSAKDQRLFSSQNVGDGCHVCVRRILRMKGRGKDDGRKAGEAGRQEGRKTGRQEDRKTGRQEDRKTGRT